MKYHVITTVCLRVQKKKGNWDCVKIHPAPQMTLVLMLFIPFRIYLNYQI